MSPVDDPQTTGKHTQKKAHHSPTQTHNPSLTSRPSKRPVKFRHSKSQSLLLPLRSRNFEPAHWTGVSHRHISGKDENGELSLKIRELSSGNIGQWEYLVNSETATYEIWPVEMDLQRTRP